MQLAVILFPGSSDDIVHPLREVTGAAVELLWHECDDLSGFDAVILPGGATYGDYLRPGALAASSPVMEAVRSFAQSGGLIIGFGNGFQILCEAGLLPGALLINESGRFVCDTVPVRIAQVGTALTRGFSSGETLQTPIAHQAGRFYADEATLNQLEANGQVVFRYVDSEDHKGVDVAGICNEGKNIFGFMGHPERNYTGPLGNGDGQKLFESLRDYLIRDGQGGDS